MDSIKVADWGSLFPSIPFSDSLPFPFPSCSLSPESLLSAHWSHSCIALVSVVLFNASHSNNLGMQGPSFHELLLFQPSYFVSSLILVPKEGLGEACKNSMEQSAFVIWQFYLINILKYFIDFFFLKKSFFLQPGANGKIILIVWQLQNLGSECVSLPWLHRATKRDWTTASVSGQSFFLFLQSLCFISFNVGSQSSHSPVFK